MDAPPFDIGELGLGWWSPSDAEIDDFDAELRSELPTDHVLAGVATKPIATKKLLKDWIVWLPDQNRWAGVHLTYRPENDPSWPRVTFAQTWPELVAEIL